MSDAKSGMTESWAAFLGNLGGAAQGPTQQIYREWERWFGAQVERLAGNQQFVGQLGRALGAAGALKPLVDQAVAAAVKARGESRTAALEARIVALEAAVEELRRQK